MEKLAPPLSELDRFLSSPLFSRVLKLFSLRRSSCVDLLAGWPCEDAVGISAVQREISLWDELGGEEFWMEFGRRLEAERDAGLPFGR